MGQKPSYGLGPSSTWFWAHHNLFGDEAKVTTGYRESEINHFQLLVTT